MDEITLRPLEPADSALLSEIFEQLGPTSRYQRYLVPKHRLTSTELRYLSAVDHVRHEALIALSVPDGRPVGVARFIRETGNPDVAEVAVEVIDAWHRRGVGSVLTEALAARALDLRIEAFSAVTTHGNTGAAKLLRRVCADVDAVPGTHGVAEYLVRLRPAC